jgi:hypothetical protein
MIAIALLYMLISSTSVDLVDETYEIPANEWRWVQVSLQQQSALLSARVEAYTGSNETRVALLRGDDLDRLQNDRPHGVLAAITLADSKQLSYYLHDLGEYAVVVDNRGNDAPASVRLRVWLDFGASRKPVASRLSPRRQITVVLISFAVFFGIVTWSARRLLKSARK